MTTECYGMIRGSALRVTSLTKRGTFDGAGSPYVVSKAVARVTITENTEAGNSELVRNDEGEARLYFVRPDQTVRFYVDIDFLRVDPELLNLVTGVPVAYNAAGDIVGFDANTRIPAQSFGLEIWSKLTGQACESGERKYGYTLFPWLKGGTLSGFTFENGLASFNLRGARSQKGASWGLGPHVVDMDTEVSRNTHWRSVITTTPPPAQTDGSTVDTIEGGTAFSTSADIVDGGTAAATSSDVVEGGSAA